MRKLYVRHDQYSEALFVLQICAIAKPFFQNLELVRLWAPTREFIPFIPLFLSSRTTTIGIRFSKPHLPIAVVASTITAFPALCPNLQHISLSSLPRDPMITLAVSGMFLTGSWNTLRYLNVDSPLTEEAREVVFKLPNLCELSVYIERGTSLPSVVLPNLTGLKIRYDWDHDWLQGFRGATLGKLASVSFRSESESASDLFETLEGVALTTSIPATLSRFTFNTSRQWRPNYHSLLPFTRLKEITVGFSCRGGCSSTIDDDIITDIARAMPKLEKLDLGYPCQNPAGITAKGLAALAHHCLHLSSLCVHFRVASLDPSAIPEVAPGGEPTIPREDCALTELYVGKMPLPKESVAIVALTLLLIFPHIEYIRSSDEGWGKVVGLIRSSRRLVDHSSKKSSHAPPRSKFDDTSPRSYTQGRCLTKKYSEASELSNFTPTIIPIRIPPPHICCIFLPLLHLHHNTEYLVRRTAERQTSGSVLYERLQKTMT